MPKKSKAEKSETPDPVAASAATSHVFVTYFGLEPSEMQRKALSERRRAIVDSTINGLIQDKKLTEEDVRRNTPRAVEAKAAAKAKADTAVDMFEAQTLPPLVVECDPRKGHTMTAKLLGGVTRIDSAHWEALAKHPNKRIKSAIEVGRLLSPEKTAELVRARDQDILERLALRTHCPHGLAMLHDRETARGNGRASRARILAACDAKGARMGIDFPKQRAK